MSNSRIPYFDFYPTDFMRGVRGLTATEVGIYTMLLCRIYEENGPVEYHPVRLSAYCGVRESMLKKAVDRLIVLGRINVQNGMLSDERAIREITIRETKLKNSSRAGKASADKRQKKQQQSATYVQQAFNHLDKDTEIPVAKATGRDDASEPDFAKQVFDRAVAFLGRAGTPEQQARAFVGKLRKDGHTDAEIFDAFSRCSKQGVVAPIPWITAALTKPASQAAITSNVLSLVAAQMEADEAFEKQRVAR